MPNIKGETMALGALFQCCGQITRVASTGYFDELAASCVLRAMLVTNPQTLEDIYNPSQLSTGFRLMLEALGNSPSDKTREIIDITKIAFKIIALELSIERSSSVFARMGGEIDRIRALADQEDPNCTSENSRIVLKQDYVREYAVLYQSLISPNFTKLIIYGEAAVLSRTENQEKIRAMILAGIRAALLWRQEGGRRRYLFFRRKSILDYARNFLR